ncbi:MAG: type II toxin-antitoxin system RelE/ParE family toxin [Candidatus Marinimicrobia bacterium]|nr:type II toxin-antitoxin system RelE/ParE family toxin [Candidatus Neomarinimicrobiota bacterium]
MKAIEWKPKATKQLKKIGDRSIQKRIINAVAELKTFPETANTKTLTNHKYNHRLRVGNWRVLFNAEDYVEIVTIEEVKKRDERTY